MTQIALLSEASVSGGALELEDLAGVVGAVGLLATLGDEFVAGSKNKKRQPPQQAVAATAAPLPLTTTDGDLTIMVPSAHLDKGVGGGGGGAGAGVGAGRALRECLSDMAREFFRGANKVGWFLICQFFV